MNDDHDVTCFCVLCLPWPRDEAEDELPAEDES